LHTICMPSTKICIVLLHYVFQRRPAAAQKVDGAWRKLVPFWRADALRAG
jgi:hypothetical protein